MPYPYSTPGFPPGTPSSTSNVDNLAYNTVNSVLCKGADSFIAIEILNNGSVALSDFKVQMRLTATGAWYDYVLGSAWASPDRVVIRTSAASPATTAGGSGTWAVIRVDGLREVRFVAKTASGSTSITVNVCKHKVV